jgi:hypothetical protein
MKMSTQATTVMPGLVPGILVLLSRPTENGWPGHLREDALRAFARP